MGLGQIGDIQPQCQRLGEHKLVLDFATINGRLRRVENTEGQTVEVGHLKVAQLVVEQGDIASRPTIEIVGFHPQLITFDVLGIVAWIIGLAISVCRTRGLVGVIPHATRRLVIQVHATGFVAETIGHIRHNIVVKLITQGELPADRRVGVLVIVFGAGLSTQQAKGLLRIGGKVAAAHAPGFFIPGITHTGGGTEGLGEVDIPVHKRREGLPTAVHINIRYHTLLSDWQGADGNTLTPQEAGQIRRGEHCLDGHTQCRRRVYLQVFRGLIAPHQLVVGIDGFVGKIQADNIVGVMEGAKIVDLSRQGKLLREHLGFQGLIYTEDIRAAEVGVHTNLFNAPLAIGGDRAKYETRLQHPVDIHLNTLISHRLIGIVTQHLLVIVKVLGGQGVAIING